MAPTSENEEAKEFLQKQFSEAITTEMLEMIDKLYKEGIAPEDVEQEVIKHFQHHVKRDVIGVLGIIK